MYVCVCVCMSVREFVCECGLWGKNGRKRVEKQEKKPTLNHGATHTSTKLILYLGASECVSVCVCLCACLCVHEVGRQQLHWPQNKISVNILFTHKLTQSAHLL